jgi:hypothetical protein
MATSMALLTKTVLTRPAGTRLEARLTSDVITYRASGLLSA